MLRCVLLGLMAESGPSHGYGLMKAFASRSGLQLGIGNVYRELQRLRADGLIVPAPNPADADARRAPYAITDAGRSVLRAWLRQPAHKFIRDFVDPLGYRLALLAAGDPDHVLGFVDDLRRELVIQNEAVERQRSVAGGASRILLRRRSKHLAADLELVDELRTAFGEMATGNVVRASMPG